MPSIFSRLKGKDGPTKVKSKKNTAKDVVYQLPQKPKWDDAYTRKTIDPEEVQELIKLGTAELKARALDIPFLLLPFRPTSDPSAVRTFVRNFFDSGTLSGDTLKQELRLTEPMVIAGVIKWCWARLQGGVVGWDAYELFKIGEQDSNEARDSFRTFIPISVDNAARTSIIFDFFDLMAAIAAHGKVNGFGGRKLSRTASWWAFEHKDTGNGFEGGYKEWLKAADATSHLFFAYLRTLTPQKGVASIALLPISLQKLLQETEYPPQRPALLQSTTNKVVMIVENVSPTPFALLRRSSHFQYRDEDRVLQEFSEYEDPIQALTDECRRVLKAVSSTNQTKAVSSSKHSTSLRDASWSRFEDIGFGTLLEDDNEDTDSALQAKAGNNAGGLRKTPLSGADDLGRPTTPSWADFLSTGFVDDGTNGPTNTLLPPDKALPPLSTNITRQQSAQSHQPRLESERTLEPGELASISRFDLDDSFWWVWMVSMAPEETPERKSAFGRCAVVETRIRAGRWLVMEEVVKGAAAEPEQGAYIAEKKGLFSWTRRGKGLSRSKSTATGKPANLGARNLGQSHALNGLNLTVPGNAMGGSKTSIGPDQQAKIQAAAQQLQARQRSEEAQQEAEVAKRRGRMDAAAVENSTSGIFSSTIVSEASPALKWASRYDKEARGDVPSSQTTPAVHHLNGDHAATTNGYDKPPLAESIQKPVPGMPGPSLLAASATMPAMSKTNSYTAISREDILNITEKDIAEPEHSSVSGRTSPPVPPKDKHKSIDSAHDSGLSPTPVQDNSPDSKKGSNRLHKDVRVVEKEKDRSAPPSASTGFRSFFNRKNRQSKLPSNAASGVNAMLAADESRQGATRSSAASVTSVAHSTIAPSVAAASVAAAPITVNKSDRPRTSDETSYRSALAVPSAPSAPSGSPAPVEYVDPAESIEPVAPVEPVIPVESVESVEPVAPVGSVEPVAPVAPVEPVRSSRPAAYVAPVAHAAHAAPTSRAAPMPSNGRATRGVPRPAPNAFATPTRAPSRSPAIAPGPFQKTEPRKRSFAQEPRYTASNNSRSRVDTTETREANREFSRFDQGPLADQPAFVPDDSDTEVEEAVPPPIARQRSPGSPTPSTTPSDVSKSEPVQVQDRWAQIRKNAAERAAKRQTLDLSNGPAPIKKSDDADDDTSGEETIESRVARIKARVAELTGNMEGANAPGNRTPPVRR